MNNEDKILQLLADIKQGQDRLEQRVGVLEQSVLKIENDQGTKIAALFDGYTLRGDQIEHLQEHLDERLDAIQNDLSYVVGKTAQHDRSIVRLNKIAK